MGIIVNSANNFAIDLAKVNQSIDQGLKNPLNKLNNVGGLEKLNKNFNSNLGHG